VGGSVAFAALGTSLAFIIKTLSEVNLRRAGVALLGLCLLIALVSGFAAWLRLRRRDISTLLEACGWALNGRMRLTFPLARLFTERPGLPPGSRRRHLTPGRGGTVALLVVLLLLLAGAAWLALHPGAAQALLERLLD
jgi:uncharacterized iron-regulated membrane protein